MRAAMVAIGNIPNGYYKIRITVKGDAGYHDVPLKEIDGPTVYDSAE